MNDEHIVRQLIVMNMAHAKPSDMLRYIRAAAPGRASDWVACMQDFRRAFGLSIKQVSPILGWLRGELSDSQLDGFLVQELYPSHDDRRPSLDTIILEGAAPPDYIFSRRFDKVLFFDADMGTNPDFISGLQAGIADSYGAGQACHIHSASTSMYLGSVEAADDWASAFRAINDALRADGDCDGLVIVAGSGQWIAYQRRPVDVGIFAFDMGDNATPALLANSDCFFNCADIREWLLMGSPRAIDLCTAMGRDFLEILQKNYCAAAGQR